MPFGLDAKERPSVRKKEPLPRKSEKKEEKPATTWSGEKTISPSTMAGKDAAWPLKKSSRLTQKKEGGNPRTENQKKKKKEMPARRKENFYLAQRFGRAGKKGGQRRGRGEGKGKRREKKATTPKDIWGETPRKKKNGKREGAKQVERKKAPPPTESLLAGLAITKEGSNGAFPEEKRALVGKKKIRRPQKKWGDAKVSLGRGEQKARLSEKKPPRPAGAERESAGRSADLKEGEKKPVKKRSDRKKKKGAHSDRHEKTPIASPLKKSDEKEER